MDFTPVKLALRYCEMDFTHVNLDPHYCEMNFRPVKLFFHVVWQCVFPKKNYGRKNTGSVAKRCGKSIQSCTFASMETTMLAQLARIVLPSEILERFEIVQIETDELSLTLSQYLLHPSLFVLSQNVPVSHSEVLFGLIVLTALFP